MPPPPPLSDEPEDEDWLVTYADAITLLMAFFVMLVSFSKIDMEIFDAVMSGIKEEIGMTKEDTISTTQQLSTALEVASFEMQMEQVVEVTKTDRGITIEMDSNSFFKPGTAQIVDQGFPLIQKWAELLTQENFKYFHIEVEGHTDDDPINTPQFPSNWELSAARASAVVRQMEKDGVHRFQMKAIGMGDSHPKAPNRTLDGEPIPVNMAKNRRVAINLVRMNPGAKGEFQDVLLEERLAEEERKRREEEAARQQAVQDRVQQAEQELQDGTAPVPAQ